MVGQMETDNINLLHPYKASPGSSGILSAKKRRLYPTVTPPCLVSTTGPANEQIPLTHSIPSYYAAAAREVTEQNGTAAILLGRGDEYK